MKKTVLRQKQTPLKKTPLKRKSAGKKTVKKPLKNHGFKSKQNGLKKSVANQSRKRNIKKKSIRRNSVTLLSKEIKACDLFFSQYIRLKAADKKGIVSCYTCGKRDFWKLSGQQNGHFKSRSHYNTRWLSLNCAVQCTSCNSYLGGNLKVFAENLVRDYGEGVLEYLDKESKKISKLSIEKVRKLRTHFENRVAELKEKLNL